LTIALILAITVFVWTGDLKNAETHTDWLVTLSKTHSIGPHLAQGIGFKGELAICRGDANSGVESLQNCIEELRAVRFHLMTTPFTIPLVQGFAATGRLAEGLALMDETIQRVERNKEFYYLPELLRVKGDLLLAMPQPATEQAETCFMQSLEVSGSQGAHSWALRTATSLANLRCRQGRSDEAYGLLAPIYDRFTEGFDTADLMTAKRLLDTLL
jgi:predicted ATPase